MTDDFVSRRHAEIEAEIRLNDRQAQTAFNVVSRCRHRVADLPVTVGVTVEALGRLQRGPPAGEAQWTLEDVTEMLHAHPAASWEAEIDRARSALDELEAALRPWSAV